MYRWMWVSLGILALAGCGPSPAQVVQDFTPAMQNMRATLKAIAEKMPSHAYDQAVQSPLDPPLIYAHESDEGNTEVLMVEELTDDAGEPKMDLLMSNELAVCLAWTEPGRTHPRGGDAAMMKKAFEEATSARYLVVHRIKRLELPRAVREKRYSPGTILVEGIVFDLTTKEQLASYLVDAQSAASVYGSARKGEEAESMESSARSTMWSEVREKAAAKLAELTGGSAQLGPNAKRHGTARPASAPPASNPPVVPLAGASGSAPGNVSPVVAPREVTPAAAVPGIPLFRPQQDVYLRDLAPVTVEVLEKDQHKLLRDFHVKGTLFRHGLYCHPPEAAKPARAAFTLGQKYTRLTGAAGQSDGAPPQSFSPLTFRILADGQEVWTSPAIRKHGEWVPFEVDVSSVQQLELRVDCPGDHSFAWGVWMDPMLQKK